MIWINKIYYKYFPKYKILEERLVTYDKADKLIENGWVLSPNEDNNSTWGLVWLCKKERIKP